MSRGLRGGSPEIPGAFILGKRGPRPKEYIYCGPDAGCWEEKAKEKKSKSKDEIGESNPLWNPQLGALTSMITIIVFIP